MSLRYPMLITRDAFTREKEEYTAYISLEHRFERLYLELSLLNMSRPLKQFIRLHDDMPLKH